MIQAREALQRLCEGNQRFVSKMQGQDMPLAQSQHAQVAESQPSFAIILSCSDARVPPEIVFDQGVGDLFIVRVAGNIAGSTQIGSVEFAALNFHTRLVVILGHTQCVAVTTTLNHIKDSSQEASPNLRSIIELVQPAIAPLCKEQATQNQESLLEQAVRANISNSVEHLRQSEVLGHLIKEDGLLVIGAEYSLETGRVEFFDAL